MWLLCLCPPAPISPHWPISRGGQSCSAICAPLQGEGAWFLRGKRLRCDAVGFLGAPKPFPQRRWNEEKEEDEEDEEGGKVEKRRGWWCRIRSRLVVRVCVVQNKQLLKFMNNYIYIKKDLLFLLSSHQYHTTLKHACHVKAGGTSGNKSGILGFSGIF